jgi:hypothetical protein
MNPVDLPFNGKALVRALLIVFGTGLALMAKSYLLPESGHEVLFGDALCNIVRPGAVLTDVRPMVDTSDIGLTCQEGSTAVRLRMSLHRED